MTNCCYQFTWLFGSQLSRYCDELLILTCPVFFCFQLSRYCDELLRNNAKGLTETETDDKLNQVILVFRYLEDKDVFEKVCILV